MTIVAEAKNSTVRIGVSVMILEARNTDSQSQLDGLRMMPVRGVDHLIRDGKGVILCIILGKAEKLRSEITDFGWDAIFNFVRVYEGCFVSSAYLVVWMGEKG